jgi:hypothetical protein
MELDSSLPLVEYTVIIPNPLIRGKSYSEQVSGLCVAIMRAL